MNKKNYIDKIELILNTSGKYITRKEKDMILDYVNYFKTKNNVIEDKNIELVIEIERLHSIIKEVREYITSYESIETIQQFDHNKNNKDLDYSTIDEMTRRYMMVHDKILKILDKGMISNE